VQGKKSKTEQAARRAAAILEEHFATLSKVDETRARKELHKLATAVSRRARGKASQVRRSGLSRPSGHSRAKTA
jgi:hypothetical protein